MKHLGKVSVVRDWTAGGDMRDRFGARLDFADAKSDYKDTISQASLDYSQASWHLIPLGNLLPHT